MTDAPTTEPATSQSKSRRYCFTVNNWTIHPHYDDAVLSFLCYGEETAPTTGTLHLQGYLECKKPTRITALHKIPGLEQAHFLIARGTGEQNTTYCSKGGRYTAHGNLGPGAGARTDLNACRDILREQPNRAGLKRVLDEFPGDFIRYHNGLEKAVKLLKPNIAPMQDVVLREWQVDLMDLIEEHSPHPRRIHFYVDPQGAAGKSFMARYIFTLNPENTLILSNGKHLHLYNCYEGQKVVIFDMTRSPDDEHDHYPYQVMENIKNGYKPPGMYGSLPEFFTIPHVIVFCNKAPNMTALSNDRYDIHCLSGAY